MHSKIVAPFSIIILILSFYVSKHSEETNIEPLKVAFNLGIPLNELDPLKVNSLSEATLLRNLYSGLFAYDEEGKIRGDLAKDFFWQNGELNITIPSDAKTSKGEPITPDDVKVSLKRLMISGSNLHGDLKNILCPNVELLTWDGRCDGITTVDNRVVLKPFKPELGSSLIDLLSSVDYRIIPKSSLDFSLQIPKIKNHENTTGPYWIKHGDKNKIILEYNRNCSLFSSNSFKTVYLLRTEGFDIVKMLMNSEIDLVPTTIPFGKRDFESIENAGFKINIEKTHKLKIRGVFFSERIQKLFSDEERFYLGNVIAEVSREMFSFKFEEPTEQFFQDFADGALTKQQLQYLIEKRASANGNTIKNKSISVAINKDLYQKHKSLFAKYPFLKPVHPEIHPLQQDVMDRPDAFTMFNDAAFNASLPLINYNLNQGFWGLSKLQAKAWIEDFLNESDNSKKMQKLNELHFSSLSHAFFYPFTANRYVLIAREGIRIRLNPFFSATYFWIIEKE